MLLHPPLYKLVHVPTSGPDEDSLTIGVTTGTIAGAIGTSSLSGRSQAISTMSFALYGLVLLIMVAIPSVARLVGSIAGISLG